MVQNTRRKYCVHCVYSYCTVLFCTEKKRKSRFWLLAEPKAAPGAIHPQGTVLNMAHFNDKRIDGVISPAVTCTRGFPPSAVLLQCHLGVLLTVATTFTFI